MYAVKVFLLPDLAAGFISECCNVFIVLIRDQSVILTAKWAGTSSMGHQKLTAWTHKQISLTCGEVEPEGWGARPISSCEPTFLSFFQACQIARLNQLTLIHTASVDNNWPSQLVPHWAKSFFPNTPYFLLWHFLMWVFVCVSAVSV